MKQMVEHNYSIYIDDNDHSIRKYFLNDEPVEFTSPDKVKVGQMVFYDHHNHNKGIVMATDRHDAYFQLYDVFNIELEKIEEVAEFQVYAIVGE
jgi:hypothetical protein